jgi:hypothetical protein
LDASSENWGKILPDAWIKEAALKPENLFIPKGDTNDRS